MSKLQYKPEKSKRKKEIKTNLLAPLRHSLVGNENV
jgi:hypothetical protein